jgi:chaperonin cofactor prefoldin
MRVQLLSNALAFILGLSIGGFALGQKPVGPTGPQDSGLSESSALSTARETNAQRISSSAAEAPSLIKESQAKRSSGDAATLTELKAGPMSEPERLQVLTARWSELENQVRTLTERFEGLERRITGRSDDGTSEPGSALTVVGARTGEDRRAALVAAGVPEAQAQDVVWRQSEQDLERLELRDQAIREGWFRSERYFEELQALNDGGVNLREEIGEQAYDSYLFQAGANNRITVTSIIPGSAAELSGMLPGDIIESYAGDSVYSFSDLRAATTEGTRGEEVLVKIRRGDALIETWVARGPVGVTLEPTSVAPEG